MNPINPNLASASPFANSPLQGLESAKGGAEVKNFLLGSIQEVNSMQQEADQAVESLATGGDVAPAEVLTAVQKADLAFRMMMQIRNKLVDAYTNIENIRV